MTDKKRFDTYQMVTDKIVEALERGVIPWQRSWVLKGFSANFGGDNLPLGRHMNMVSRKSYRGINVLLLNITGYESPFWVTYRQAQKLKGSVKKGEKGTQVVYWKWLEIEDKVTGEKKDIPFLRYFTVFNIEQCEGIKAPEIVKPKPVKKPKLKKKEEGFEKIEEAEEIVAKMLKAPTVKHGGDEACYSPLFDRITMPTHEQFKSNRHYYGVLFHELAHSTGHDTRLCRKGITAVTSTHGVHYSKEELIAEMASAMLCSVAGIDTKELTDNSAAYVQNWLRVLKNDKKMVVLAAGKAQKAADYIQGIKKEKEEKVAA